MTEYRATAGFPVLPMRIAMSVGMLVCGAAGVAAGTAMSGHRVTTLGIALAIASFGGGLLWLGSRRGAERQLTELGHAPCPASGGQRRALLRGVLTALLGTGTAAAVVGVGTLAGWADASSALSSASMLAAIAVAEALSARDLRRWQEMNSLVLYTNADAPRFAVRTATVLRQPVLVRLHDHAPQSAQASR